MNRLISIAPMMDCTDRHYRYFMRLITPNTLFYTEMVVTGAILFGHRDRFLRFDPAEQPLALQLGGSNPAELAECAKIAEDYGYCEVNLNIGCPSDRVQSGRIGACLMAEPELVAECVAAMQAAVNIPITVKTRIGIDDLDSYEALSQFVSTVARAGCKTFIIHARKAWLKGLSPKQNRDVPPLKYEVVHRLKKDFPELEIIINGGFKDVVSIKQQLQFVDGVMIGRAAYDDPYLFALIEQEVFGNMAVETRQEILRKYLPYLIDQMNQGVALKHMSRHILGLFNGVIGAKAWRRNISERVHLVGAHEDLLLDFIP